MILRIEQPFKASMLLFASGKAVIARLKASSQIDPVVEKLLEMIKLD
jgi:TATA-box binding protein (TBP) (component of TFIID and TFIIIB)